MHALLARHLNRRSCFRIITAARQSTSIRSELLSFQGTAFFHTTTPKQRHHAASSSSFDSAGFSFHNRKDATTVLIKQTFTNNFYRKMSRPILNYYAHSFIDRCSERRKDHAWLNEQLKSDKSVFVLFHVDRPFIKADSGSSTFSLTKLNYSQVKHMLEESPQSGGEAAAEAKKTLWLFLGVQYDKGANADDTDASLDEFQLLHSPYSDPEKYTRDSYRAWFAIDTSNFYTSTDEVKGKFAEHGDFFEGNFLRLMAIQDLVEASIIAQARSVFCWHDRNKFCATCGTPNVVEEGGFKRACKNPKCKANDRSLNRFIPSNIHYPRVDPVVIMLVVNPARTHFLLGRKKQFPEKMFSCLAGYVEAGESIEEAVRREVFEESGIYTDQVVYHSSQPWPFPSTLMMGCLAYATSNDITVDTSEIEEAKWFSLDEIDLITKNQHPDKYTIPNRRTIANQLINYFIKNKAKL